MSKPKVDTKGNIHIDDAFLEEYINKGGQVQTSQGTPVDSPDALLEEVGKDHKSSTKHAQDLHKEVEKQQKQDQKQERENAKAQKEAEDAAKRLKKSQISQAEAAVNTVKKVSDPVLKKVGHSVDRLTQVRTVGGIGLLLFILIFLLFIVVEVNKNGDTRIKQLWYMLVGRATLVGRKMVQRGNTAKAQPNLTNQLLGDIGQSITDPIGGVNATANDIQNAIQNGLSSLNPFNSFRSNDAGF